MKSKLSILPVVVLFLFLSCKGNSNNKERYTYSDGKYVADVVYYNPKTGTRSTETLKVEVENDTLTRIYWSNDVWLDDSHFKPQNISLGTTIFTSDNGYIGVRMLYKEEEDDDETVCPLCGRYKYLYDDYCDDCHVDVFDLTDNDTGFISCPSYGPVSVIVCVVVPIAITILILLIKARSKKQ